MAETVLVTGAAGTVGSALVERLSGAAVRVRAGVHSLGSAGGLPDAVEPVEIELTEPGTLEAAFDGVDRILDAVEASLSETEGHRTDE